MSVVPIRGPQDGDADDLTGRRIGRFLIRERLGRGGMGEVYLAHDTVLRRRVAVKRIPPRLRTDSGYRKHLLAEAERASQLNHPNIASIYDILEIEDELFLVMEHVEGETLRSRLRRPIDLNEFIQIVLQCAAALNAAHSRGIVHCDVKPENIMITTENRVKMLDFGIARRLPERTEDDSTLETGLHSFSGTPSYMAPELLLEKTPDGRADIFSLGVVCYEALSGRNPFLSETVIATAERVLRHNPPRLSAIRKQIPAELDRIIARMIAKPVKDRYAQAADVITDLAKMETVHIAVGEALKVPLRRRWKIGVAAATLMLVIAAIWMFSGRWLSKRESAATPQAARQLAILPFTTDDQSNQAFSNGLSETLSAKLSRVSVHYPIAIVPTSEARAEGVSSVEQALKILGVNMVLEGHLRESAGMVRVTYSIVEAKTHRQLGGDSITMPAADPFAMEDHVVNSILTSLQIVLQPQDRKVLAVHGTNDPQAYDFYLQGRGYLQDYHKPENIDSAITVFRSALQRDPNYALAWAGMGEAYWYKYDNQKQPVWMEKSRQACEHAIRLDQLAAEPHTCLGMVLQGTGHYDKAVEELKRAVQDEPNSSEALLQLAKAYVQTGEMAEAEETFRRAIALKPSYWGGYNQLGVFYTQQARYSEALSQFQKVVSLAPDNVRGYSNMGGIYVIIGDYAMAIPVFENAVSIGCGQDCLSNLATAYFYERRYGDAVRSYQLAIKDAPNYYLPWGNMAEAYYWMNGHRADAERTYRKAIELARQEVKVNPKDADVLSDLALYYAMIHDRQQAFDWLAQILASPPSNDSDVLFKAAIVYRQFGQRDQAISFLQKAVAAGCPLNTIRDNPIFDDLRNDPAMQAIMSQKVR